MQDPPTKVAFLTTDSHVGSMIEARSEPRGVPHMVLLDSTTTIYCKRILTSI